MVEVAATASIMLPQAATLRSLKSQINRKGEIAKSRTMEVLGA
jgi:hypothetical protein